jgi:hypothetical protein
MIILYKRHSFNNKHTYICAPNFFYARNFMYSIFDTCFVGYHREKRGKSLGKWFIQEHLFPIKDSVRIKNINI